MNRGSDGACMSQFYPPVPQPYFLPKPSDDILKVGVQVDRDLNRFLTVDVVDKVPQLLELNQREPLINVVNELCSANRWNLSSPDDYALQFTRGSKNYVTEQSRNAITNGDVLILNISPGKLSSILYDRLVQQNTFYQQQQQQQQPPTVTTFLDQTLKALCEASGDPSFVHEFVTRNCLPLMAGIIETGSFQLSRESLAYVWISYWQLMENSATSWDTVSETLIGQMADYVLGRSKSENPRALSAALAILEAVVNGSVHGPFVERSVPLEGLIRHLENSDIGVQQQTLALMNALFAKTGSETKKQQTAELLSSKPVRNAIAINVLRDRSVGVELTHQLHVFQRLLLNVLDGRARIKPSIEKVNEFRKLALDITGGGSGGSNGGSTNGAISGGSGALSPTSSRRNNVNATAAKDYKKLGFRNLINPVEDFELVPPGSLALDCLSYLAKHHPERFAKIILENSCRTDGRDYPFVQTSLQLICRLLILLNVGETPQEEGGFYYEVLFTHEHPFEELASYVLVLFGRTWKEMRALYPDDMTTVLQVIEDQVRRSLNEKPRTFEQFDEYLRKFGYAEIARIRETERAVKEKSEFESKPILELQEKLKPEMLLLVRANRLNGMKEGQTFVKYGRGLKGAREKGKFWHWKLSPTEQYLLYEDCEEKQPPRMEDMKSKISISDIERVAIGNDCQHVAREVKSKKVGSAMAVSIFLNNQSGYESDCFNFLAPNMPTYNLWIDGLFALLNHPMPSNQAVEDVDMLLNMEIKVRLLDLEDTILPAVPPPLPPLPPNFNF